MKHINFLLTFLIAALFPFTGKDVFAYQTANEEAAAQAETLTIPCPENYPTHSDETGADFFGGSLDQDGEYFPHIDFYHRTGDGTLHILSHFQTYQQTTESTCGPASALMVLNRFGVDEYDEMEIAGIVKTAPGHGTLPENLAAFFEDLGWNVEAHTDTEPLFRTAEEAEAWIIEKIDSGTPVMVDWIDWLGHWEVIIGIDTARTASPYDDVLIFADPYDVTDHLQDGYYIFPFGRFFSMWQEGPVTTHEIPYQQPLIAARPE